MLPQLCRKVLPILKLKICLIVLVLLTKAEFKKMAIQNQIMPVIAALRIRRAQAMTIMQIQMRSDGQFIVVSFLANRLIRLNRMAIPTT